MSVGQLQEIEFIAPKSLDEACRQLAEAVVRGNTVWPIAGCTDWMVQRHMENASDEPRHAVAIDTSRLAELKQIELSGDMLFVGAGVTFAMLRSSPVVKANAPVLVEMAATVGAEQIQRRGTLGGNLVSGSPAADGVTALVALDAMVKLRSAKAEREVPIRSYYTGYRQSVRRPDEIVVGFSFEKLSADCDFMWKKIGTRKAQSIAKASIAAIMQRDSSGKVVRVGFGVGSVAERVVELAALRGELLGKPLSSIDMKRVEKNVENGIRPIDDLRSTAAYRRHVVRRAVMRFLGELGDS